jgi:CxxH/CxxC protein (TIGR04129 family)
MPEKNKYTCDEHIDLAFDDFLVEYETFPSLEKVKNKKCSYCSKEAAYSLSEEHND